MLLQQLKKETKFSLSQWKQNESIVFAQTTNELKNQLYKFGASLVAKALVVVEVKEDTTTLTKKNGDGDTNSSKGRGNTSRSKDKSHMQCFKCIKHGHYKTKCRTKLHNEQDE